MFSIHDAKVQHSASPNSRNVMNRHELASYCELLRVITSLISSTDFFSPRTSFCPQIITDFHRLLNIKDILIITDYYHH